MRAPALLCVLVASTTIAVAETKPTKVDIKPFRDELIVLQDADGGTYVVRPYRRATASAPEAPARLFFGVAGRPLYEQVIVGRSANGAAWSLSLWAPRVPQLRPADFEFRADGTYRKGCDGKDDKILTQLTGDKAKAILDKATFMTEYMMRRAHMLARDDKGTYYFVDRFANKYGGKGYRVFVGRKGAMKQLALTDVASDSAGEVFSTSTGDLRLTRTQSAQGTVVTWIKGEKKLELIPLDVDVNSTLIFSDLGIYKFLGTLCDNL